MPEKKRFRVFAIAQDPLLHFWSKLPASLRAIVSGLLIGLVAANVWPVLLLKLGVPFAVVVEVIFLFLYILWTAGEGPPPIHASFPGQCIPAQLAIIG